jgi:hypothetical protein
MVGMFGGFVVKLQLSTSSPALPTLRPLRHLLLHFAPWACCASGGMAVGPSALSGRRRDLYQPGAISSAIRKS